MSADIPAEIKHKGTGDILEEALQQISAVSLEDFLNKSLQDFLGMPREEFLEEFLK